MILVRVLVNTLRFDAHVMDFEWALVEDASKVLVPAKLVLKEVFQGFKVETPDVQVAVDKCRLPVTFTTNELAPGGLEILVATVTVL